MTTGVRFSPEPLTEYLPLRGRFLLGVLEGVKELPLPIIDLLFQTVDFSVMIDSTPCDDADEDAIGLDDESLIEACLKLEKGDRKSSGPRLLPDWPPARNRDCLVPIDADIAAWFRQQSSSWKQDIVRVLRAWIAAQTPQPAAAAEGTDQNPSLDF